MLPASNRLRSSKDFARTTKSGFRATTPSLVLYTLTHPELSNEPRLGVIINSSVGGSVVRHRIARKLRHNLRNHLATLPEHSQIVVRVLRRAEDYSVDLAQAISHTMEKVGR